MATPIQTPLAPFTSGFVSVVRTKGTTFTSGNTARLLLLQATPAASPAYGVVQVKDNVGTFRDAYPIENAAAVTQRSVVAVIPPLTDYRFIDKVGAWTVDAAWEAN